MKYKQLAQRARGMSKDLAILADALDVLDENLTKLIGTPVQPQAQRPSRKRTPKKTGKRSRNVASRIIGYLSQYPGQSKKLDTIASVTGLTYEQARATSGTLCRKGLITRTGRGIYCMTSGQVSGEVTHVDPPKEAPTEGAGAGGPSLGFLKQQASIS